MQARLSLGFLLAAGLCRAAEPAADAKRWFAHIEYLASDKMQGRNTGSSMYLQAAEYVARQFKEAGLQPGGNNGYFQPVRFQVRLGLEGKTSVALVRDGKPQPLTVGDDVIVNLRGGLPDKEVEAPVYFVGYGLTVPEHQYDDLRGLDVKGKIVMFLTGGPSRIPGALRSHYSTVAERSRALLRAGAIGTITVANPKSMDVPWERTALTRFMPSMVLAEPSLQEGAGLKLGLALNPDSADKLLAGSGHTFKEILAAADSDQPLPQFAIPGTLKATVGVRKGEAESPNVVGILPGSDPKLKDEYVVFSAHLDHVGVGHPINGDSIYNGAMDNASGVATLIETARAMQGRKLARSVVFVAVCGEEKGLLGSRYFASKPPLASGRLVGDINTDMYMPLHQLDLLTVYGLDESTLGDRIQAVAKEFNVGVQRDPEPNRNLFIRSDQYSFIREGVPALAFKFGYKPGSAEEKMHKAWLRDRYHAPSDDLNQPMDREAAVKFNNMMAALLQQVANAPAKPEWKPDSFFKRFEK